MVVAECCYRPTLVYLPAENGNFMKWGVSSLFSFSVLFPHAQVKVPGLDIDLPLRYPSHTWQRCGYTRANHATRHRLVGFNPSFNYCERSIQLFPYGPPESYPKPNMSNMDIPPSGLTVIGNLDEIELE